MISVVKEWCSVAVPKYNELCRTSSWLWVTGIVDGEQLANRMIEYNLGISTVETYEVKRVDYDFFYEDV